MHDASHRAERGRLSRRAFVAAAAAAGAAASMSPSTLLGEGARQGARAAVPATPVVGFHMDRPYLDPSGMAEPYIPPAGTRSGQALAALSESEFLSRHPYG